MVIIIVEIRDGKKDGKCKHQIISARAIHIFQKLGLV